MLRRRTVQPSITIHDENPYVGRALYIFAHPDDESFGPAPVIAKQRHFHGESYDPPTASLFEGPDSTD